MSDAVTYKKPRKFNIVVILILGALLLGGYLAWVYLPVYIRKAEVVRVLDETSSAFTGQASRMLNDDNAAKKLKREMISSLQAVGVEDPDAEYWIEVDDDDQVRFGVLYSDMVSFAFTDPKETVHEVEVLCTRPGRGTGWTCETRDLISEPPKDDAPVEAGAT